MKESLSNVEKRGSIRNEAEEFVVEKKVVLLGV